MLGMNLNRSQADVDRWLDEPMTKMYFEHLDRHLQEYKNSLIYGTVLEDSNVLIALAKSVGAIEALESKQKLIFFDMKREIHDDNKRISSEFIQVEQMLKTQHLIFV